MKPNPTKTALLDLAEELAQTRGINAFSFNDLAAGVGISTASVHHHFRTKEDLALEMVTRYRDRFRAELTSIDNGTRNPRRKMEQLVGLFRKTLRRGERLCLCGMLAAEYTTLPEAVQREVRGFFEETERWVRTVLDEGTKSGVFKLTQPAGTVAKHVVATLEGAMIVARTFGDERRLSRAARWVLAVVDADGPLQAG